MKFDRAVVASALLLASGGLHAYQIIEGRYRVEVSPGTYEDQLVVRCDDGRTLIVRWETKLAQACGEGLMGGPAPKAAHTPPAKPAPKSTQTASPAPKAVQPPHADPAATTAAPAPTAAANAASSLFDEQSQKEAMLAQVRAQFGNVPERYVEFKPGADGLSMRFLPPLSDILKKYETCRKAREARADCAADRDGAIAKLSESQPSADARDHEPAATAKAATPAETSTPVSESADVRPMAVVQPGADAPGAVVAPDRSAAQQKIAEDYTWCMRAKPKFECDQERAKALSALDKPKPAAKPKRPAKQAAVAPNVATAQ
jgi:hypothetical protein